MAVNGRSTRRPRPPLNAAALEELALAYVGRFATSRAKLGQYLARKVKERGWDGHPPPDFAGLAERFTALGYIDDRAFAAAKARSLSARGYGARRLRQALAIAGIDEEDRVDAEQHFDEEGAEAALRYARRKRIGPFANVELDRLSREKALAAMIRAGHGFALSRRIVEAEPGAPLTAEDLGDAR